NQSSTYSREFINRYTHAQANREANLVITAQDIQQQIANGRGDFSDDSPFPTGHDAARIWQQDTRLLSHTKGQYPLITPTSPNGTVQVINSVRVPSASVVPSTPGPPACPPPRRKPTTRLPPRARTTPSIPLYRPGLSMHPTTG